MRIDPRIYTLDANERHQIVRALVARADGLTRVIERKRASRSADTDRSRAELDVLEMDRARCEDLLAAMR